MISISYFVTFDSDLPQFHYSVMRKGLPTERRTWTALDEPRDQAERDFVRALSFYVPATFMGPVTFTAVQKSAVDRALAKLRKRRNDHLCLVCNSHHSDSHHPDGSRH